MVNVTIVITEPINVTAQPVSVNIELGWAGDDGPQRKIDAATVIGVTGLPLADFSSSWNPYDARHQCVANIRTPVSAQAMREANHQLNYCGLFDHVYASVKVQPADPTRALGELLRAARAMADAQAAVHSAGRPQLTEITQYRLPAFGPYPRTFGNVEDYAPYHAHLAYTYQV